MKKILITLTIATTLFLSACGDSDSNSDSKSKVTAEVEKPFYDFSSKEAAEASLLAQREKEGFSEEETKLILKNYKQACKIRYKAEYEKLRAEGKRSSEIMIKYYQGRTLAEMKKIGDEEFAKYEAEKAKNTKEVEKPVYDFSSEKAAMASLFKQGEKEGFTRNETMLILGNYEKACQIIYKEEYEKLRAEGKRSIDIMLITFCQGRTLTEMKKIGDEVLAK